MSLLKYLTDLYDEIGEGPDADWRPPQPEEIVADSPTPRSDPKPRRPSDGTEKIRLAIEQVRADLTDLERHLVAWDDRSTSGTKTYRPIARRIIASAQRLKELVAENTF